ncbi:hypothetical protein ACRW7K_24310, partial [Escherichia coli]
MIGWGVCVLALALADRYLLKRKDITHLELGDVEIKPGFIRVPFKYRSKFPFLRGATVRYWIRDVQKPTTVIEGEPRQPGGCKLKTAPVRPVVAARPAEYVCSEDL